MADYVPLYEDGPAITTQASATITGGNLIAVSGSGTSAVAGANAPNWQGVAAFDVVSGDKLTVHSGGVQRLVASGAITAGDIVVCAAAGKVSTLAAVTTPTAADVTNTRAIVGIALTTAADTALVEVQMDR